MKFDVKTYIPIIGDIVYIPFSGAKTCFKYVNPSEGEWKIISGYNLIEEHYWNHKQITFFRGVRYIGNIRNILESKELEHLFE